MHSASKLNIFGEILLGFTLPMANQWCPTSKMHWFYIKIYKYVFHKHGNLNTPRPPRKMLALSCITVDSLAQTLQPNVEVIAEGDPSRSSGHPNKEVENNISLVFLTELAGYELHELKGQPGRQHEFLHTWGWIFLRGWALGFEKYELKPFICKIPLVLLR